MGTERFQLLKLEFDAVIERLQRTEDANERLMLLEQMREIIAETDELIRISQREIAALREKLLCPR
jgi:hypothetical protein